MSTPLAAPVMNALEQIAAHRVNQGETKPHQYRRQYRIADFPNDTMQLRWRSAKTLRG